MKLTNRKEEVWLRGEKIPGLTPLLQPAADALLQAGEELDEILDRFPDGLLWERFNALAPVGFHLKHIAGFQDRLLTYAEGKLLAGQQLAYLKEETFADSITCAALLDSVHISIRETINRYKQFGGQELLQPRAVGRVGLPSTVIGLCFHAAEHTMRHTGQVLVTVAAIKRKAQ